MVLVVLLYSGCYMSDQLLSSFTYQDCISYAYLSLDSAGCKGISFTLAAITKSNYSRTSRRVWGDKEGVIWLCVLRRSKSSDIWRLCRVSVGLSLDYG